MISITAGAATHVGRVRQVNEDAFFVGRHIWAVADGMGGHAAGEVAARLAVEAMQTLDQGDAQLDDEALSAAVVTANSDVLAYGRKHPRAWGLGTTLAGVAVVGENDAEQLCVFNLGDSRVYRLRQTGLERVSVDHSEVEELINAGLLTPKAARTHPLRNIVTRCLGMPSAPEPDLWVIDPEPGERLLLCSDGLNGELDDATIEALLRGEGTPAQIADALVAAAVDHGGQDNVTVVVLAVGSS